MVSHMTITSHDLYNVAFISPKKQVETENQENQNKDIIDKYNQVNNNIITSL